MVERRKHKRYRLKKEAFVKHFDNLGTILDLSMGGMLCECTVNKGLSPDSEEFGICYGDDRCVMNKIKIRRITEKVTESLDAEYPLLKRKCGIQFEGLSKRQKAQLKEIISAYQTN